MSYFFITIYYFSYPKKPIFIKTPMYSHEYCLKHEVKFVQNALSRMPHTARSYFARCVQEVT